MTFQKVFPDLGNDDQAKVIWNLAISECIALLASYAHDDGHEGTVRKEGVRRLHDLEARLSYEAVVTRFSYERQSLPPAQKEAPVIVEDPQYQYLVLRGFNGSSQYGAPIRLTAGSFVRCTKLTAKCINTSQPFTLSPAS